MRLKTGEINTSGLLIPAQFPKASQEDHLSPEKADALRQSAERIRALGQQQTELTLAIGKELISAKVRLSDRGFEDWTRQEFGMAIETARSYVAVAKQDAGAEIELVTWDLLTRKRRAGYLVTRRWYLEDSTFTIVRFSLMGRTGPLSSHIGRRNTTKRS
jgi:hypothetical protein